MEPESRYSSSEEGQPPVGNVPQEPRRGSHPIHFREVYSLRDAALALQVDERQIRRAILLNDLPAIDVADDRHYLISGETLIEYARSIKLGESVRCDSDPFVYWM